jgi:hypothetical protein
VLADFIDRGGKGQLARSVGADIDEPKMVMAPISRGVRHANEDSAPVGRDLGLGEGTHMA